MYTNLVSFKATNQSFPTKQARVQSQETKKQEKTNNIKSTLIKTIPYAVGALGVLAVAYKMRGQILKLFKQGSKNHNTSISTLDPKSSQKQNVTQNLPAVIYHHSFLEPKTTPIKFEPTPELRAKIRGEKPFRFKLNQEEHTLANEKNLVVKTDTKIKHDVAPIVNDANNEFKEICIGFTNEGKPIYDLVEMPSQNNFVKSAYKEAFDSVNFNDKNTIDKIKNTRLKEQNNINRILDENTSNGNVDINTIKKIANDYMLDNKRGETRFHQAADLLEQAYIKQHIQNGTNVKAGMCNLVDGMTTDPVLYKCYQNMPLQESANRLNYLKEQDLKNYTSTEGMNNELFFEKTFSRLVDKYQMKRYNEAHGIN